MFSLKKFIQSFRFALRGLKYAWSKEQSFRLQIIIAILVIGAAFYFGVTYFEGLILGVTILIVLSLELINTMLERVIDLVEPTWQRQVGEIKDILAGAVLIAALGSIIIGAIIFWPYFFS